MTKVLVLGASGMLGNVVLKLLSANSSLAVKGTIRSSAMLQYFSDELKKQIISGIDVENFDGLMHLFSVVKPDVVINCIGVIKQLAAANDVLGAIPVNTIFPHRLARLCDVAGARLIHISTDCVFNGKGKRGHYVESDVSDAEDIYGKSKYLGEVSYPNTLTLRTSIIGHEFNSSNGLVEWFLKQEGSVKGFTRMIFSGLPTVEIARVINEHVIPDATLQGVYHLASAPISKYELLRLIAAQYKKNIEIVPDDKLVLDRSLNASRFNTQTGYQPPDWVELVKCMYEFK